MGERLGMGVERDAVEIEGHFVEVIPTMQSFLRSTK
jgi:hypothetical protein